jgi:hypothetical protein
MAEQMQKAGGASLWFGWGFMGFQTRKKKIYTYIGCVLFGASIMSPPISSARKSETETETESNPNQISMERATSLTNLSAEQSSSHHGGGGGGGGGMPPQSVMQNSQTDNELVDDILKEINHTQADGGQQQPANPEFDQHMDPQVHHNLSPANAQQLNDYHEQQVDSAELAQNGRVLSERDTNSLLQQPQQQQHAADASRLGGFDIVQFAKTLLLTMILFIVVTNKHVHGLLCKIPYMCTTTIVEGIASSQVNFIGTILMAFVSGLVLSTAQAFV